MSKLASRLPARPSLEQLRKRAKDLLRAYRAGDATAAERFRVVSRLADRGVTGAATLADAQFVIAREYGFESWPKLVHHVETLQPDDRLERFEQLATDLTAAHQSGDAEALKRLGDVYGMSLTRDAVRAEVQRRSSPLPDSTEPSTDFDSDAAKLFVARQYGFGNWAKLAESVAQPPSDPRSAPHGLSATPPFYRIDWTEKWIEPRPPLFGKDWDTILGVMKDMQLTGLSAGGQMSDAVLERVTELEHVTRLDLGGSKRLTDAGLRHLARLPQLQHLDLSGCAITNEGLEVLRRLPELKTFQLYHYSGVSDAGVAHLADCDRLEHVNLMGTRTGDGAIKALAGKPQLHHFEAGNGVTDAGLALLHEFPVFKIWQGGEPQMSLMSSHAGPNLLWLNLKAPFTNEGLATLAGLDGLYALNLFATTGMTAFDDRDSGVTAAGVGRLVDVPNLGWLGCCARLGNDESMRYIGAMPRLRFLMCQDAVAGDAGFAALGRSNTIEYIWGRRCYNLTGRGFAAMAAMPALRGLSVSCKNVDDAALSTLPSFPALEEFMPMDVPDEGFRHVGRCGQLEALWCMYCRDTGDRASEHIAGLSRLKTYYAGSTQITDKSLEILGRLTSLEHVSFESCSGVTDAGLAALARLPRLREVSLDGLPNVTREGVALFAANVHVKHSW